MALRRAKILPTVQEKRHITLNFLEAAYMSGTRVIITPVTKYSLSTLSGESFEYGDSIETWVIYDERPKVSLLKRLGWYREDQESLPQIAHIPTHLLYRKYGWSIGNSVDESEPQVQPVDGDKWADVENNILNIYEVDQWVQYSMPTEYYAPTAVAQYFYNPRTTLLHTSIFAWSSGKVLPVTEPTENLVDGTQWFDEAADMLYTYVTDAWDAGVAVPTSLYEPMSEGLYYFDEGSDKLYVSTYGERVVNEVLLNGNEMQALIVSGESDAYLMKPLQIKRGSLVDIFYDFAPDAQGDTLYDGGEFGDQQTYVIDGGVYNTQFALEADLGGFSEEDDPYDFPVDNSVVINRFYITEPRIDTVSIQYVCKIMPYKFDADKEQSEANNESNGEYLDFDSNKHQV